MDVKIIGRNPCVMVIVFTIKIYLLTILVIFRVRVPNCMQYEWLDMRRERQHRANKIENEP